MKRSKPRTHWLIQVSWEILLSAKFSSYEVSSRTPSSVNLRSSFSRPPTDSYLLGRGPPWHKKAFLPGLQFGIVVTSVSSTAEFTKMRRSRFSGGCVPAVPPCDDCLWASWASGSPCHWDTAALLSPPRAPQACFDCVSMSSRSCGYCGFGMRSFEDDCKYSTPIPTEKPSPRKTAKANWN